MDIIAGILVCSVAVIFVILLWVVVENNKMEYYRLAFNSRQTINDIKENIIDNLDEADKLGYEIMFRTPECVVYKNCKLHIAKTENGKEVIMVDLI